MINTLGELHLQNPDFWFKEFELPAYHSRANGQSYYHVICPFCNRPIDIQVWSAKTTGKKCDNCSAVLRESFYPKGIARLHKNATREIGKQ